MKNSRTPLGRICMVYALSLANIVSNLKTIAPELLTEAKPKRRKKGKLKKDWQ